MIKTIDVQNNDCGVEHAVSIPARRYADLVAAEKFLAALYAAGLDNWEGYSFAMETAAGQEYGRTV